MAINDAIQNMSKTIQEALTADENGNATATVYAATLAQSDLTPEQADKVHTHDATYIPAARLAAGRFFLGSLTKDNAGTARTATVDFGANGSITTDIVGSEEIRKPGTAADSGETITTYAKGTTIVKTGIDPKGKTGTMGAVNKELDAAYRAALGDMAK